MAPPPPPPAFETPKRWHHYWPLWTLLALGAAAFFGWPKVNGRYQRWKAAKQVRQAEEFIAQRDFRHAMIEARSALTVNPMDPQATLIMARALEAAGSPAMAAGWRSRLDTLRPGDPANLLAWAADALKGDDLIAAERILSMLKPEPKDDANYHAIAGAVAMAKKDLAQAGQHWAEAARLAPGDVQYRLQFALTRLGSKTKETRADAVKTLEELSLDSAKGAEALRALLADAAANRDWAKATGYADTLSANSNSTFADRLARLGLLRETQSKDATGYLTELRDAALKNPGDLYLLFMWMNQHDLALMVTEWSRALPPDVASDPTVCVAVADACVHSADWQRLRQYVSGRSWADLDYLRRGFLARALDRLGETARAEEEWKDAIAIARSRVDSRESLEKMVRLAITWGWEQRAQEVMWSLAGSPTCPRWMLDALWLIAIENSDTAQLQKLAAALVQCDSKSVNFRNNYAFYSLLVHSEDGDPHREAERLSRENPGDATVLLTRALSLYQQGKVRDSLALTDSLPAEDLQKPRVALYHGIFLTAVGESAKAAGFIAQAQSGKIFPEEKAMLERARKAEMDLTKKEAVEKSREERAAQAVKKTGTTLGGKNVKDPLIGDFPVPVLPEAK